MSSKKKVAKKKARRASMQTRKGGTRTLDKDGKEVKPKAATKATTEKDKTDVN